ncbi:protein amalgam-like isoform X2 [Homarus americanus]|uniref:protein amalgam-like isoform X2 n=1 Tax=Homarus americanus TaxID=6706 RepID=UPI001C49448A|nr:protein amalgam-like isoform X2 [Homarus americanus]
MEESGYDGDEEEIDYGEPPEFAMGPQHLVAKEGDTININCQPNEESPYVILVKKAATETSKAKILFVGDVKVQRNRRYKLNGHMVEISNIRASDAGTYICSVETQPPLEIKHELEVQYAPKLKMISEAEQHVLKGESVRLECQSEGNPTPTIHWSRQEGRLPSGAHEEEGLSMLLEEVDRHVEGTYVCMADNGIGEPVSASMSVMVEYQPEIITEKAIVRTGEGDKVELVCIVHSRPTAEVTWSKDGQTLTLDNHLEEQNGGHRHSLRISQVTEEDFGEYVCTAANEHGTVRASIHMTGQPKPPHFTSDPNGGEETSYTLTWETESYYPILQYRLTYRKAKANDSTDEPGEWHDNTYEATDMETQGLMHYMKHTINDLEPATDYHAIILVKNKFMWGANTEFAFSTKKEVAVERKTSGAPSTFTCFLPIFLLPVLLLRT